MNLAARGQIWPICLSVRVAEYASVIFTNFLITIAIEDQGKHVFIY